MMSRRRGFDRATEDAPEDNRLQDQDDSGDKRKKTMGSREHVKRTCLLGSPMGFFAVFQLYLHINRQNIVGNESRLSHISHDKKLLLYVPT